MSAPPVGPKVPLSVTHVVTVSRGPNTNTSGARYPLARQAGGGPPAARLAGLLARIPAALEAWWSPHVWIGDRRAEANWQATAVLVVDFDYHDGNGKHAARPPETGAQLEQAALEGKLPGNVFHLTPRGGRVVYVPAHPLTDPHLYARAIEGACVDVRRVLEALGLHARQDERGRFLDGLVVDEGTTDRARAFYIPHAIVRGEHRTAAVRVIREDACDVSQLAELVPPPAAPSRNGHHEAVRDTGGGSTELLEAVRRFNQANDQDWGRPGSGQCPTCGHRGCFGRLPAIPEKWCCFSGNHEADSGGVGYVSSKGRWIGDALDLEAHHRKRTRVDVLREDGYLKPDTDAKPQKGEITKTDTTTGPAAGTRSRRTIMLRPELSLVTDEAETALLNDPDAGVYVRARQLVRIVHDTGERRRGLVREPDSPVIQLLSLDALRGRIDRAAEWVAWDKVAKKERPAMPPEWVARDLAARGSWRFPYLEGVIEAPTLKPDGELLDTPGYDADSGLMLLPSGRFPAIPPRPTRQDALEAVVHLLEPFADFPFLDHTMDLAAAVAAVLSLVARYAIEGCVPLFAVRAPAPGTGKGLLADVVCLIGTGRPAARMTLPREDAELRKVILTVAMEGAPAVLLDNVDGALGSQSLASALTAGEWEDRLLGVSARVRAPLRAVWIVTGNGVTFRGDLGRRVVPIDLDAQEEHPEDRTGFAHADLVAWTRHRRPQLVADALTLLRAYHVAGRPKHRKPRKGSFEAWDDLVRGACVWVGLGDPCAGTDRVRREDDSDLSAIGAALEAWHEAFAAAPKTAAEAVGAAGDGSHLLPNERDQLRDALLGLTGRDKLDARSLGNALRKVRGRIVGGRRFATGDEARNKVQRWLVPAFAGPRSLL